MCLVNICSDSYCSRLCSITVFYACIWRMTRLCFDIDRSWLGFDIDCASLCFDIDCSCLDCSCLCFDTLLFRAVVWYWLLTTVFWCCLFATVLILTVHDSIWVLTVNTIHCLAVSRLKSMLIFTTNISINTHSITAIHTASRSQITSGNRHKQRLIAYS